MIEYGGVNDCLELRNIQKKQDPLNITALYCLNTY